LQRDLTAAIDKFKTGNARTPTLAPEIEQLVKEAWLLASIQFQARTIRSGVLLLALLSEDKLSRLARDASRELGKIQPDQLFANLMKVVTGSSEDEGTAAGPAAEEGGGGQAPRVGTQTPGLDQFTVNLTERAKQGKIDPV